MITEIREAAKGPVHEALHTLAPRIPALEVGDCHCNLLTEVALDALDPVLAEVAALRQQLDEARDERDRAIATRTEAEFAVREEKHARKINEYGLLAKLRDAEADRDRLLVVYRAAEKWRNMELDGHLLAAAVDSYRSAAPAEPAAAWTPARDGDTPGELVPGEGEQVLPVDGAS